MDNLLGANDEVVYDLASIGCCRFSLRSVKLVAPGELALEFAVDKDEAEALETAYQGLRLKCKGVKETNICGNFGRSFEHTDLQIAKDHPLLFDYGEKYLIYGKAPLPDPFRLYWEFSQFLQYQIKTPRLPIYYLNIASDLNGWMNMCYGRTFLLMTVPEIMLAGLSDIFYAQAFEYSVLKSEKTEIFENLNVLKFTDSWVVCERVEVTKIFEGL